MEEAGKVRRGYFVESLGGTQFAYPGVVERLRQLRDDEEDRSVVLLAATDPANPFGWLLPWPDYADPAARAPRRAAGASVVLVDGSPVLYLDRGGRRLRTQPGAAPEDVRRGFEALRLLARRRPRNTLILDRVDGHVATESAHASALMDAGFTRDYLSLRLYAP
jgi:ATP-dependent Lhr-like helicase